MLDKKNFQEPLRKIILISQKQERRRCTFSRRKMMCIKCQVCDQLKVILDHLKRGVSRSWQPFWRSSYWKPLWFSLYFIRICHTIHTTIHNSLQMMALRIAGGAIKRMAPIMKATFTRCLGVFHLSSTVGRSWNHYFSFILTDDRMSHC